ncbi:hypothetical protein [Lysinibacillus sp. TE18511]
MLVTKALSQDVTHLAFVPLAKKRLDARPQEALLCAKAKRQRQMFYLCESEASATKRVAWNGNRPH